MFTRIDGTRFDSTKKRAAFGAFPLDGGCVWFKPIAIDRLKRTNNALNARLLSGERALEDGRLFWFSWRHQNSAEWKSKAFNKRPLRC